MATATVQCEGDAVEHDIEAFVQDMVSDLKNKPANPFRAMADYVRAQKLNAAAPAQAKAAAGAKSCGDSAYDSSPKYLMPKPLGAGGDYAAQDEGACSRSARCSCDCPLTRQTHACSRERVQSRRQQITAEDVPSQYASRRTWRAAADAARVASRTRPTQHRRPMRTRTSALFTPYFNRWRRRTVVASRTAANS